MTMLLFFVLFVKASVCTDCACVCNTDQTEGGKGRNTTSLKLGVEPKATKVALNPASLSPVETSSRTEQRRTVVLFKPKNFSPGTSLNGYKMRSLFFFLPSQKCQKNLNEKRQESIFPLSKTTAEPNVACSRVQVSSYI